VKDDSEGRLILARGIFRLRRRRGARNHLVLGKRGAPQKVDPGADPRDGAQRVTRLRPGEEPGARANAGGSFPVEKWQALGNDFLLVWDRTPLPPARLAMLCHRHLGVGADGILFLQRQGDSIRAQLFNQDGSPAEYSGNGLRCVIASAFARQRPRERLLVTIGKLLFEGWVDEPGAKGPGKRGGLVPENAAVAKREGPFARAAASAIAGTGKRAEAAEGGHTGDPVLVLDPMAFTPEVRPAPGELFSGPLDGAFDPERAFHVKLGNPHLIMLVDDLAVVRGPAISAELDRLRGVTRVFPQGVNVSVAQPVGANRYLINTWERGVGPTAACASAATALFHLLRKKGLAAKTLAVTSPGGTLSLTEVHRTVQMKGPARRVFSGVVDPAALEEP
jgi:diaminopimelate epimerase